MFKLPGVILIVIALATAFGWVAADRPNKGWVFTVCLLAIFAGCFLTVHERATEISVRGIGTIKAAAKQATSDATAITELRDTIEAQSATVHLVAQEATKASNLAEELGEKTAAAESKLVAVDEAMATARQKAHELDEIVQFTKTVIAAQNDDRKAFDQLEQWANDLSFPFQEEALSAYRTTLDQHSQPFYVSGLTVPWQEGVDPSQLTMTDLRQNYHSAPVWLKPALVEHIWKREDLSKKQRMAFLAKVVEQDDSLKAVEYAGRYLCEALNIGVKPLAIKPLLRAWEAQKESIE